MDALKPKVKQAVLLWLDGFREACCLHRVVFLCLRSRMLLIRTGQCFLLNGFLFLGSILVLNSVVISTLEWILPDQCPQYGSFNQCSFVGVVKLYSFLRSGIIQLFYIFWFYPLYVFSFVLSTLWYNDIAKYAFIAMGKDGSAVVESSVQKEESVNSQSSAHMNKHPGLGGVIIGIGEQVYSVLLLSFFFLEVFAAGFIPYVGKALNFLLLSWMYAYYSFEYKWNLAEVALDKRLDFFESNWAFFAGFGGPCVLAIFFFSPLVSYGVMAILYPLFVVIATGSEADHAMKCNRRTWRGARLGRLPIFYAADTLS
ncbi:protein EI24 homolog isoform X2 [Telopea speciosissima]|uniref:protein EI24 homolog isoform X2 n=1 Tax=Telopea speciosissima TaxID=54955 RepID=UPI001CC43E88|nr:protein EI24 homolog isoform X2 [Telopea speciosissima]